MTNRIILAGVYYHQKYPGSLIFYRLDEHYVAFEADAERAAKVLQRNIITNPEGVDCLQLLRSEFLDAVELLAMCGISVKGISYRDDSGEYAVPDVKILSEEEEIDY